VTHRGVQEHFQQYADGYYQRNYDAPRGRHQRTLALRREVCLDLLAGVTGPILDLGCGPGALAVPLAREGRSVVALDLAQSMVEEARRIIGPDASCGYVVADAAALPFASESFAAVVTTGVLEYVPEVPLALAEIRRVLRPGGVLVATVSLPRRLERNVIRYFGSVLMRLKNGGTVDRAPYHRAFSADEFDQLLAEAHLAIESRRHSCFTPFPLDALYPPLVTAVDRLLATRLESSELATSQAKTYIVRATKP
jgi:ubiquinone/menaquinone biosynthesis C-methylase UbiE